ncbi:hypothetical protein BDW02DRAFT_494423 [Decorospora gaudefroyi]|uniref:Phosphoglycerate mutase-like protein n=1 Tax=Decorospora gaudefroyi TaxID=184978 RepID=A0A6A5KJQ8_9PLEO|nr:hypothetical protein BDW02DRAFT_494423 [Decorospora gaudefroyi]
MAKGPAVVVVARHGARLDAADKSWHLTSPAPYDPPLTYGGWSQAKALGQRIAALLHQRDTEQAEAAAVAAENGANTDTTSLDFSKLDLSHEGNEPGEPTRRPKTTTTTTKKKKKKKKRTIIVHSSPFLRCVQTSIAVAAGISQHQPSTTPQLQVPTPSAEKNGLLGNASKKAPRDPSPAWPATTFEPLADPNLEILPKPHTGPERILLRIDAFLGEWLSPEYYTDITAPPNSTMMVAGAKADLLRRGDYIQEQPNVNNSKGHFPGGWMGKNAAVQDMSSPGKGAMPTTTNPAPLRERSSSYHGSLSRQGRRSREVAAPLAPSPGPTTRSSRLYEPPHPSYSVSAADPIPRGYVAHAQEACVKVDFQWDSMREPQNWGDGGEYGDEWSTMHKRFRRGLAGMMQWYRAHGTTPPKDQFPGFMFKEPLRLTPPPISHAKSDPFPNFDPDIATEEDEELVLVLVTHGAGCNALLGAMTNQPVLMDIGLASLSMAVQRDAPTASSATTIHARRLSVVDPAMSDTYEVRLSASIDHLRPGVDPSKLPSAQTQTQSLAMAASPSIEYRRRFTGSSTTGSSSPLESPFSIGEPYRSWNSSLSSVRRTMSSGSNSRFMQGQPSVSGAASPSGGLWSGTKTPVADAGSDGRTSPGADMVLNFANQHPQPQPPSQPKPKPKPTANTSTLAADSTANTGNRLTKLDSKEEREVGDKSTPLVSAQARKQSTTSSPGLWGAKVEKKSSNGLWGPPKLDDVYEHSHGPKRRWTVTERKDSL